MAKVSTGKNQPANGNGSSAYAILPKSTRKLAASISRSPERSRSFLIEAGILTKGGKLTSRYK
jgi:hypothetical protein